MKIIFTVDQSVKTPFGSRTFRAGDILALSCEDAQKLIKARCAIPYHSLNIARKLSQIDTEDVVILNEAVTLFDGRIVDIKTLPKHFDTSQCKDKPKPYGKCGRFTMKLNHDQTLWAYCLRGRVFCPYSSSMKGGGEDMIVLEKEKPSGEDGLDSVCL